MGKTAEISVTGLARLLIRFAKEKSDEERSRELTEPARLTRLIRGGPKILRPFFLAEPLCTREKKMFTSEISL